MTLDNKSLIEMASKQVLSEVLGFDEGRVYFFLLINNSKAIDKEYSHSKKYRILRHLFKRGAIGKIKPENKDFFSYILLPPFFLEDKRISIEVVKFLENKYTENYSDNLKKNFFQISMKSNIKSFTDFLKKIYEDQSEIKLDFSFSKIRTKDGHEHIGHVEVNK